MLYSSSTRYLLKGSRYHKLCLSSLSSLRFLGTTPTDNDENKDSKQRLLPLTTKTITNLLDASARGIGQVIFLNSPISGGIVLGGLAIGSPYLAGLAALGTLTANTTAHVSGLDSDAIQNGLMGYNGCLVGCAAAVFSPTTLLGATTFTLMGAAATPFVVAALKPAIKSVPQWTLAFNFVTLSALFRTRPLLPGTKETAAATNISPDVIILKLMTSPLTGISQIFVVESALAGSVIVGGIAVYSPGLAAHALMGSTIGTAVGAMCGADSSELAMGLWGFNSCLTSLGVGVFFVHSTPAVLLSAGGAAATAVVFGAMQTVFGAYGSPCLTLPFCVTMSACYLLHDSMEGLMLAKEAHSPEKNLI
jgi:urea transporter